METRIEELNEQMDALVKKYYKHAIDANWSMSPEGTENARRMGEVTREIIREKTRYLEQFNLRNEGEDCGWSAVVEDGRRVYGDTIGELYDTIHG